MDPQLSVVIPTRNRGRRAAQLVGALTTEALESGGDLALELIVVDDASRAGERDQLVREMARYPTSSLRLLRVERQRGAAHARNTGLAASRGAIIAFLDDDLVPCPGYLLATLREHQRHSDALVINGDIATAREDLYARFWRHRYDAVFNATRNPFHRIQALSSGHFSVKRRLLDHVSPLFDAALTSREDLDLFLRLDAAGIPVFKSNLIRTLNDPRRSLWQLMKQHAWYARGEYAIRCKYPSPQLARARQHHPDGSAQPFFWLDLLLDITSTATLRLESLRREVAPRALVHGSDMRRLVRAPGKLLQRFNRSRPRR